MKKFASLATGAVVASMIVPVFAVTQDGSDNDTSVTVNEQAIALVAGDFAFTAVAPRQDTSASQVFNVITNKAAGYTVKLNLSDLEKAGVRANGDLIDASTISGAAELTSGAVAVNSFSPAIVAGRGLAPADMKANPIIARSDVRSLEAGDDYSVELSFNMPWIETGAYAGTATWTADSL